MAVTRGDRLPGGRRPDQDYDPPGPLVAPGGRAGIFRGRLVVIGPGGPPGSGLYVYNASTQLLDSIAATAGTGPSGGTVVPGIVNYDPVSGQVVQLTTGAIQFYGAAPSGYFTPASIGVGSGSLDKLVIDSPVRIAGENAAFVELQTAAAAGTPQIFLVGNSPSVIQVVIGELTATTTALLEVKGAFAVTSGGENITGGSIIDTLEVTGATDLDGALDVAGNTVLNGSLTTKATSNAVKPGNPGQTASTTKVMAGIGSTCTLTPGSSGKVLLMITGTATTATAIATVGWGGRYGTGTAPINGAADTGTHWGPTNDPSSKPQAASIGIPFALNDVVSLTPGTAYWFDLAFFTGTAADVATLQNLSFTAVEIM